MGIFDMGDMLGPMVDLWQGERAIDRDADAADTAWRRGQENMGISNAFAAAEAQKARDFNWHADATKHQREVADLRTAGLNPMLSLNRGGSVSGPSASSSMANAPQQHSVNTGKGLNSYMIAKQMEAELANKQSDTELKRADQNLRQVDYNVRLKDQDLRHQQIKTEEANTRAAEQTADMLTSDAKGRAHEGDIEDAGGGVPASVLRWINRISESIQGAASAKRRAAPK